MNANLILYSRRFALFADHQISLGDQVNSRERILTALDHREPDRVPIDIGSCGPTAIHVNAYTSLLAHLGITEKIELWDVVGQLAQPSERVLEMLGADVRGIRVGGPKNGTKIISDDTLIDPWGITWFRTEGATCYNIREYPLRHATQQDLATYPFPDGKDPHRVLGLAERAQQLREQTNYAILGEISGHILERAQMVRGFDTFLEDLVVRPAFADELMDRILAIECDIAATLLDAVGAYLDVFAFKDDIGMQAGPLISPKMFRARIKPRLQKLIEVIKSKTRAKIWFHSCGSVYYAVRDLIEIGVDILNPVQVAAKDMDTARLKREFGNNIAFWGAIDTQNVLPFGSPQDVKAEVKTRLRDLAPGGGYVLASVHNLEADVCGANVWAMAQAAKKFGAYPLRIEN
jgi:uroporphyrinogen decarboxylase